MDANLRKTLDELPAEPGCYLMKDRRGAVVYVGKASSLRSRVRSYFDASRGDDRAFVALLDELLGDVEVIVTRSEKEAVLLENELIKRHRPRFNIRLRDDKDFIVLRLDERHAFPRLEVRRAREPRRAGARYFGPYSSASSIRETLRVVNRHFQLRTCTDHVFEHRKRPCILYQIKRCPAPCVYDVPEAEYRQSVEDAIEFLEGRETELVERLHGRMDEAADALRFEDAARLRDQLQAVERSLEKQRVLMADRADRDVVGLYREGPDLVVQVLAMRAGKLQDSRSYPFHEQEFPDEETLSSFLSLYYEQNAAPEEILVPVEPAEVDALADVLSERRGRRVRLLTPQRGAKADLLEVAARNAEQGFRSWHEKDERREQALAALTRALHLARPPRWMECYDISTFQGALAVGSGVSFRDGEPDKACYRRYKVKGVAGQDDFAMLYEVVSRRLRRALGEGAFPDLLVIDGGKGQLNAALAAAKDLGVPTKPSPGNEGAPFVELVGLAKSRLVDAPALGTTRVIGRRGRGGGASRAASGAAALADAAEAQEHGFVSELARSPERVFLPGRKDPVVLRQNSAELFLLARLRDEAHRFAITFHRKLRRERNFQSVLEEISGIGEGRKRALLRHFGALRRVKEATLDEISQVDGFGPKQARAVFEFFHPPRREGAEGAAVVGPPSAAAAPPIETAAVAEAVSEEDIDAALAAEDEDAEGPAPVE
ncbi:excinuclease ABC subunit UvrC [Anaeromyxobacter sp. Fw109-5]|uniref:UvrABC system protein C n=1 Tax=Anaeromyxobacter sp. (strain Fw109-5) TaxID=404589 RepID=UVRC_ANADF|nr:excinuclease ABC subunit UvrC [Anaeromyxobacter sp. Fw109-5]A7HD93.1 RecName: Full=UvrABC system protein C; Short=Protein UvrC; AltName: Full=Excinuclease ABC subunit C [Anaeromyxobacter sp. Fw109-5]ABS26689.1 excinuclease ABC, C subunit [Anaeromyxobacter sp. Fw109-5]